MLFESKIHAFCVLQDAAAGKPKNISDILCFSMTAGLNACEKGRLHGEGYTPGGHLQSLSGWIELNQSFSNLQQPCENSILEPSYDRAK